MKGKGAEEINSLLTNVRHKINQIQNRLIDKGEPFSASDIKNLFLGKKEKPKMILEVFDEHNKQMKSLVDIEFALGYYNRYFTIRDHIFTHRKDDFIVRDVNLKFIKDFQYLLKEKKSCNHNSALKYVNNFKKIIHIALAIDGLSQIHSTIIKSNLKLPNESFFRKKSFNHTWTLKSTGNV